jgi:hypothetical protein
VTSRVRLPWEEVDVLKCIKVDAEAAAAHKASIVEMELVQGMYVVDDEGGRAGKVAYVYDDGSVRIRWLDTGKFKYERDVSRERLALAVASLDDQAALAAAGWRAEWTLLQPISTMHPALAGSAEREEEQDKITLRRSLHDSGPEAGFGEVTLHERWLEERADADPIDFAELHNKVDSSADSRTEALERRLTHQMQQIQECAREQQKVMEEKLREQQASLEEKMERQAEESNKRLDRLITLVSVMQAQQQQAETD